MVDVTVANIAERAKDATVFPDASGSGHGFVVAAKLKVRAAAGAPDGHGERNRREDGRENDCQPQNFLERPPAKIVGGDGAGDQSVASDSENDAGRNHRRRETGKSKESKVVTRTARVTSYDDEDPP
jgi:hypothetical protein